ncbi:MAG: MarR family transcriptional regulator [Sphingomicrobium sp.]
MSRDQVSVGALAPLVGYHLRRAWSAFSADFTTAMEGTGLRQVPFAVLSTVVTNPGINQGTVGRTLNIKRANMVSLINELVDKGLIDRAVDANDRRAFSLSATAQGHVLLAEAVSRIEQHERGMLSDMTAKERATLLDLLGRIERRSPPAETDENGDA